VTEIKPVYVPPISKYDDMIMATLVELSSEIRVDYRQPVHHAVLAFDGLVRQLRRHPTVEPKVEPNMTPEQVAGMAAAVKKAAAKKAIDRSRWDNGILAFHRKVRTLTDARPTGTRTAG